VQYVRSPAYVNALVLRDRSTLHNGTLDERVWVQQDANWNVTALVNSSGLRWLLFLPSNEILQHIRKPRIPQR